MLLLPLCLLAATSWLASANADGEFTDRLVNLTEPMVKCLKRGKVYWHKKNSCHDLPSSPCGDRSQWLVLDVEKINQTDFLEPVCKPKPCLKPLEVSWHGKNISCVKRTDAEKTECPKNNEVGNDMYGEGVCICKKSSSAVFLPLSATVGTSECSPLYDRGPCEEEQILMAHYVEDRGFIAKCHPDPCAKKYAPEVKGTLALDNITGNCYPLGSLGPCDEATGETFKVSQLSFLPECIGNNELSIFNGGPPRCPTYPNGECKKPVDFKFDKMMANIKHTTNRKRKRKN